jgi:hypothetical protein
MAEPSVKLDKGEKVLHEIAGDRGRYWRDHAAMALVGMVAVAAVLWLIGNEFVAVGALGALLAIGARGLYLASEQLKARWWLTSQRLVLPDNRSVMLLEIETVRPLMGDVQIVTRAGDKHLIKHVADAAGLVAAIRGARDKRRKVAR